MYASLFEVAYVGRDSLRINPVKGGTGRSLSFAATRELLDSGAIAITYQPFNGSSLSRAGLSDPQIAALNRKLHYVQAVARRATHLGSQRAIAPVIKEVAAELGDAAPPKPSTVAAWVSAWRNNASSEAALMPKPKPTRRRFENDSVLAEIIATSIKRVYLHDQRNPISAVHADVALAVHEHNANQPTQRLTVPSAETVRRHVKRVDAYQCDVARHGKQYARRVHRAAGIAFYTTEPLELTMADGQMMDIVVIEEAREGRLARELGRPYVTVLMDVFSRCILGVHISLAPFCGATLLRTLRHAVVPHADQPRGIPGKLIVDNGSDYQASGFIRACTQLGITLEHSPPRMPDRKTYVERFYLTLNEKLIHKLPGTTFSNATDRGDYQSQDKACMTLCELRDEVDTWLRDHYHVTEHGELVRTPQAVWAEALENKPVRTLRQDEAELLTRKSYERTVVKGCVLVHDLRWGSDALATWESRERKEGRSPTVEVRLDELDLSFALVLTPGHHRLQFKATARRPQYMEHLSLYEHNLLKQALKQTAAYERLMQQSDTELYRLRVEYFAALGHADDKVAAARRERLRDTHRERDAALLQCQLDEVDPKPEEPATPAPPVPDAATDRPPRKRPPRKRPDSPPQPPPEAPPNPASDDAADREPSPDDAAKPACPANPTDPVRETRQPRRPRLVIKREPR
jgi:putative transposase